MQRRDKGGAGRLLRSSTGSSRPATRGLSSGRSSVLIGANQLSGRLASRRDALASTMPARRKSARCSPPPLQAASWLRPRSRRRRNDVGGRVIIGNIRGELLANDVGGEQTLNIGKAGQITQKVAPPPGAAVASVTC